MTWSARMYQVSGYDEFDRGDHPDHPHGPNGGTEYEVRLDPDDPRYATSIFMTGIGD